MFRFRYTNFYCIDTKFAFEIGLIICTFIPIIKDMLLLFLVQTIFLNNLSTSELYKYLSWLLLFYNVGLDVCRYIRLCGLNKFEKSNIGIYIIFMIQVILYQYLELICYIYFIEFDSKLSSVHQ